MAPGRKRSFCLFDTETNEKSGRYTGQTPQKAALSCFSTIITKYKKLQQQLPSPFKITIKEITQNSNKKIYMYEFIDFNANHEERIQQRVREYERCLRAQYSRMGNNKTIRRMPVPDNPKQKITNPTKISNEESGKEPIADLVIEIAMPIIKNDFIIEI